MDYREHPVPSSLRSAIDVIWTLEYLGGAAAAADPIIPDGRAELIVHFGDGFERCDEAGSVRQPRVLVAGQLDHALRLRPMGRVAILGIRLAPWGAWALTGVPQHELVNRTEDATDVCQLLGDRLRSLRARTDSPVDAAAMVGSELMRLRLPGAVDPRLSHMVHRWREAPGIQVSAMGAEVALTRRQTERLFREQVGLPPRTFCRIRRLQRALASLEREYDAASARPGTTASAEAGYADQGHFTREFRSLAGMTPSMHLLQRAALTGLFVERHDR